MYDTKYATRDENGNFIEILPIEKINKILKVKFDQLAARIDLLEKENKKLKEENYKDEELRDMKKNLEKMRADYNRGFPISESEQQRLDEWITEHELQKHPRPENGISPRGGVIGGSYTYLFTPTSIGIVGRIECSCGETFCFCDLI